MLTTRPVAATWLWTGPPSAVAAAAAVAVVVRIRLPRPSLGRADPRLECWAAASSSPSNGSHRGDSSDTGLKKNVRKVEKYLSESIFSFGLLKGQPLILYLIKICTSQLYSLITILSCLLNHTPQTTYATIAIWNYWGYGIDYAVKKTCCRQQQFAILNLWM